MRRLAAAAGVVVAPTHLAGQAAAAGARGATRVQLLYRAARPSRHHNMWITHLAKRAVRSKPQHTRPLSVLWSAPHAAHAAAFEALQGSSTPFNTSNMQAIAHRGLAALRSSKLHAAQPLPVAARTIQRRHVSYIHAGELVRAHDAAQLLRASRRPPARLLCTAPAWRLPQISPRAARPPRPAPPASASASIRAGRMIVCAAATADEDVLANSERRGGCLGACKRPAAARAAGGCQ